MVELTAVMVMVLCLNKSQKKVGPTNAKHKRRLDVVLVGGSAVGAKQFVFVVAAL